MLVVSKLARAIAVALPFFCAAGAASAAELDYTLYAGLEHSDNINLSATAPVSQNVLIPGVNFSLVQMGSSIQATAAGTLEYRDYLGNTFDSQTLARLSGQANWTVIPQRLDFTVQDNAGVQPLSVLASDAPDNQQQTNVVAAGPTLYFQLGQTIRGQAELRYVNSYASKSREFNSSRGRAALRIIKDMGPDSVLSGNVEEQRIKFDERSSGPDYSRSELYGRYINKGNHFDFDTTLGWSQLRFDNAPTLSSPLIRAAVDWRVGPRSTFTLAAAREYSDAAEYMLQSPEQPLLGAGSLEFPGRTPDISTGNTVIQSQAYLRRSLQMTYAFIGERYSLRITPSYEKLHYTTDRTFDRTGRGGSGGLDFRLRERLTLSAFANVETTTYQSLARRDRTTNYGATLVNNRTQHWSWRLSLTRRVRNSSQASQSFRANEIYAGVTYRR